MSSSNCCFLTCIQISQEAVQVVSYSHLFQNFPVYCDPHRQRLWLSRQNRSRCFFWNSLAFSMIQQMLAIWSLVPLPFLNPARTSGISQFTHCWSLAWRILSITLLVHMRWVQLCCRWAFFGTAFLWDWSESDLFQSSGQCWVFQIRWHIECSTFTASSFKIWNSSAEIPLSPLALFIKMLPKVHLTSHSRMSGSKGVITPLWLSGSWRSFFFFF